MQDYHVPFYPDTEYHILSRAVGDEKLFRSSADYECFMQKMGFHVLPIIDLFAYAFVPNHFHLLARIKKEPQLLNYLSTIKKASAIRDHSISQLIMQCFSNFLNSYSKTINRKYQRRGALFIDTLRRVEITTEDQFHETTFYVHKNPVHHGYCTNLHDWTWSSYPSIISGQPSILCTDELLGRFGGMQAFMAFHNQPVSLKHPLVEL